MGDAVTGISRADSANGEIELGRCCANFMWFATAVVARYCRAAELTEGLRRGCQHCGQRATQPLRQAAYPPPRESCVRGADRAAVDKRFRSF